VDVGVGHADDLAIRMPWRVVCYKVGMRTFFLSAALAWCAVACSAGPPPSSTQALAAPRANPGVPAVQARGSCGIPEFQATVLARVNAARARGAACGSAGRFGPAKPLSWNEALAVAAERHTRDMVAGNFFSHTGSTGSQLRQRADEAGYNWRTLAENIAGGRETVNGTLDQWLASPGHCANLMKSDLVHVGVACVAAGPRNTYTHYWTMALGAPLR
jgi:uncharacterized protein YkwD